MLWLQGGTNFGFMGGGEWEGGRSTPIIASYDYAAPITEGGDIGPKFLPLQSVIRKHFPGTTPPPPPAGAAPIPKKAYGTVVFDSEAPLFQNLAHFNTSVLTAPQNMEALTAHQSSCASHRATPRPAAVSSTCATPRVLR